MTFKVFADAVHQQLATLTAQHQYFFKADAGDLFQVYLSSFPEGTDPIFRERRNSPRIRGVSAIIYPNAPIL